MEESSLNPSRVNPYLSGRHTCEREDSPPYKVCPANRGKRVPLSSPREPVPPTLSISNADVKERMKTG